MIAPTFACGQPRKIGLRNPLVAVLEYITPPFSKSFTPLSASDEEGVSRGNMNNDCETCKVLWQEYARATHAHIAAGSKLDVAKLRHENDVIARLLPEVRAAADHRTQSLLKFA